MLLSLVFSVVLLGSTAASPGANSTVVTGIVAGLTEACMDGVRRTVVGEIRSEQNRGIAEFQTGQQETVQELRNGQQRTQEQLTALQEQLTALQKQLMAPQPVPEDCPAGWSRHGHTCYLIPSEKAGWHDADATCAALDRRARLASVHRAASQHIKALKAASGASHVWIGLSRDTGDGWVWSDGTPLDYTNWAKKQPNNLEGNQNCVYAYTNAHWGDDRCSNINHILCQISLG